MRERRQRARRSIGTAAGIPRPFYERLFFVMFEQSRSIEVVVLRTIGDCAANSGARENAIIRVLPAHRERREVPVMTAGNAGAVGICFLMTARAIQSRHAFAFWSTHDIRDVTVPVVSLLRIVRGRVTVDTARAREHRIYLFPRRQALRGSW